MTSDPTADDLRPGDLVRLRDYKPTVEHDALVRAWQARVDRDSLVLRVENGIAWMQDPTGNWLDWWSVPVGRLRITARAAYNAPPPPQPGTVTVNSEALKALLTAFRELTLSAPLPSLAIAPDQLIGLARAADADR